MCGFAGIVTWDNRHRVHRDVLEKMSARIAHRGPDGAGLWINHEGEATASNPQAALTFRRLAILDPDPRAMQPFHLFDPQGNPRLTLVFNGEIYNFRELRQELSHLHPGYLWRTTGDTEVLLLAYDTWRGKCVEKLNGMFAFAIWDQQQKTLFLSRDRMGQKPLYIASDGDDQVVAFASEISPLCELNWGWQKPETGFVADYLRWGYVPQNGHTRTGVFNFRPSERVTIHGPGPDRLPDELPVYFDRYTRTAATVAAPCEETRRLVSKAVERQLVSDVPLGVFLSGGIDSSVIAACARRFGRIQTFSIGFEDRRYDERTYAQAVAKYLGTDHHSFVVTPDAICDLPRLAQVFGEPFGDSSALPTHYLARETRTFVKVALSGDGGDELFGGYDRYRAMAAAERMQALPALARATIRAGLSRVPSSHPKSLSARLRRFGSIADLPPSQAYANIMRVFSETLIVELLGQQWEKTDDLADQFETLQKNGHDVVTAALALDCVTYLPGDLLTKVDRCSMLHALEVRSPFMDHELVQFAAGLTTPQLLKGGPKRMLREAFAADLPAWVFKRKKMGFAVPIGDWFRTSLRAMLHDHLFAADSFAAGHFNQPVVRRLVEEHESQRVDHSQRLYALLMLELWWKTQAR